MPRIPPDALDIEPQTVLRYPGRLTSTIRRIDAVIAHAKRYLAITATPPPVRPARKRKRP